MDLQYNITYREKDKGWQFIISYKTEKIGRWKQKSKQGFNKKSEAKKAADKMLVELKEALVEGYLGDVDGSSITFKEFYEIYKKDNALYQTASTANNIKFSFNAFKTIHSKKLNSIKIKDIQDIVDSLYTKGLKDTSVKTRLDYIKLLFNSAKNKYKLITTSPCDAVKLVNSKEEVTRTALTDKESQDLLNALQIKLRDKQRYYLPALLALTGGFRIGEILGLTEADFDFDNSSISINKQFKLLHDGACGLGSLKSKNSNRIVPMPSKTMDEVKEFTENNTLAPDGRIFDFGFNRNFQKTINHRFKVLGFNICMHELRHTYATKLIANGVDFKTAAYLLGHDVEMTMNIYTHVNNTMLNNAKDIIKKNF